MLLSYLLLIDGLLTVTNIGMVAEIVVVAYNTVDNLRTTFVFLLHMMMIDDVVLFSFVIVSRRSQSFKKMRNVIMMNDDNVGSMDG